MVYKDLNDYELLYLVSERSEDAYNEIYKKYHNIIAKEANKYYRYFKHLGIEYDDLYQSGFIGLDNAIRNFSDKEGVLFYSYASLFIKREIQSQITSANRNKHNILNYSISLDKELDDDTSLGELISNDDTTVDEKLMSSINRKRIIDLKYNLPPLQAAIYELRLNNFSNIEISNLLDISYKSVDNALHSIKKTLKKYKLFVELS